MKRILLLFLFLIGLSPALFAQYDPDSSFAEARKAAHLREYLTALDTMKSLHQRYPQNTDYTIYLGRVMYWLGDYDGASELLDPIVDDNAEPQEAFEVLLDVEVARYEVATVERLVAAGIAQRPSKKNDYLFRKAKVYAGTLNNDRALEVLDSLPRNSDVDYLRTTVLRRQKNRIRVGFQFISYGKYAPEQHYAHVEYISRQKKISFVPRITYGNSYNRGLQFELDVYPLVGRSGYIYLNAGYSPEPSPFPTIRAGAEYYYERNRISASLGARFLQFHSVEVQMLTGHFEWLSRKWLIGYRPFAVLIDAQALSSHNVYFVYALNQRESFLRIDVQYGTVPYFYYTIDGFQRNGAFRAGLAYSGRIGDNFFVEPAFFLENEKYEDGTVTERYIMQLNCSYRF